MNGSVDLNETHVSSVHIIAFAVCKLKASSLTQNLPSYRVKFGRICILKYAHRAIPHWFIAAKNIFHFEC
jgi:hypothetical protein